VLDRWSLDTVQYVANLVPPPGLLAQLPRRFKTEAVDVLNRLRVVVILLVIGMLLISPSVALAQVTWHSDQLIEGNAGYAGANAYVAMSGSNVVAVWRQDDGSSTYRIYSNHSTDGGATWHSAQLIDGNAGYDAYGPSVAMSGSNVVAVWYQKDSSSKQRIYSNYSTDGGATWNSSAQLIDSNAGYDGRGPSVAISGSHVVAVWWQYDANGHYRIYSNYSTDGGATWEGDQLIETTWAHDHWYPSVAISGTNVVAIWQEYVNITFRIHKNYSADAGATWTGAQQIQDDAGHDGWYPYVAMSGSSAVAVWCQNDGTPWRFYSDYSTDGGATWHSDQPIQDNAVPQESAYVAISGSNAVAVWRQSDGSNARIYSNYSTDGGATWEGAQLIEDNAGYDAIYPYVAMSGSSAVAVWSQSDGSNPRIYSNYSADGGATWEGAQLIEDNAGYNGWGPHVAMSGSNAVAVWHQDDGSSFRIYSNYLGAVVGYEVYRVNIVGILAPWIASAIVVAAGGLYLFRRMANNSM
jgi:hypothetical protein